jgi:hypothetical protein
VSEDSGAGQLEGILEAARTADGLSRIDYRDRIVAFGEAAVGPMRDWLADSRLSAFAVRVLQGIGQDRAVRRTVIETLQAVDREDLPRGVSDDIDVALRQLGATTGRGRRSSVPLAERIHGLPGVQGRGYWVMRTSRGETPVIWAEATKGRLRQGWGWDDSQNLDVIAEARRLGRELNDEQRLASRARRMRTAEPDGMRVNDLIVAPNLPSWPWLSVFRVSGAYDWDPIDGGQFDRFGHMLPVDLLAEGIDRHGPNVTDALRSMLHPQTRLYRIDNVGGDVERLLSRSGPGFDPGSSG